MNSNKLVFELKYKKQKYIQRIVANLPKFEFNP